MQEVVIKIKGDSSDIIKLGEELKKLGKTDSENAKQFEENSKKVKKAAKEQTSALREIFSEITDIKGQFINIGKTLVAAFAVQEIINFGKESVQAFQEAELNAKRLSSAVMNIGGESDKAFTKLIDQSEQLQEISIFSDDSIQQAQTQLVQFGLTSNEVEKLIPKILDLASATGTDLGTATDTVIQGINGQTRALKPLGLEFKNTGDKAQNLAIIQDKLGKYQGQTNAVLNTSSGVLENLKNKWDNVKEKVGEYLLAITGTRQKTAVDLIKDEQMEFKMLELRLNSLNPKAQERVEIIKRLQEKYPDFLKNIKAEKVTNDQLKLALEKVNNQYIAKIALKENEIKVEEAAKAAGQAAAQLAADRVNLERELVKAVEERTYAATEHNKELIKGLPSDLAASEIINGNIKLYSKSTFSLVQLSDALKQYNQSNLEYSAANQKFDEISKESQKRAIAIKQQFNVTLDEEIDKKSNLGKTDEQLAKEEADREKLRNKKLTDKQKQEEEARKAAEKLAAQQKKDAEEREKQLMDLLKLEADLAYEKTQNAAKEFEETLKTGERRTNAVIQIEKTKAQIEIITTKNSKEAQKRYENAVFQEQLDNLKLENNATEEEIQLHNLEIEKLTIEHNNRLTEIDKSFSKERKYTRFEELTAVAEMTVNAGHELINALNLQGQDAQQAQKVLALGDITISTAKAIAALTSASTIVGGEVAAASGPAGVFTGPAASTAFYATQIVTILANMLQAKQLLGFKDGTPSLQRGNNPAGVDTIPIMANEGEAIIPTHKNRENPGLAKAWIKGNLDDFINVKYVIPALKKQRVNKDDDFANRLGKAINLNGSFNDLNLLESDKENRRILRSIDKTLKSSTHGLSRRKF